MAAAKTGTPAVIDTTVCSVSWRDGELQVEQSGGSDGERFWAALSSDSTRDMADAVVDFCQAMLDEAKRVRDTLRPRSLLVAGHGPQLSLAVHTFFSTPADVMGHLLSFVDQATALSLAATCWQGHEAVIGSLRSLHIEDWKPKLPSILTSLPSLDSVVVQYETEDLPAILADLLAHAPHIGHLDVKCGESVPTELCHALPRFPTLQHVVLPWVMLNGMLADALAACPSLLTFSTKQRDYVESMEDLTSFLRGVAACTTLQQLEGLWLRDSSPHAALLASAVSAWPQLQLLDVTFEDAAVSELTAALAHSCPLLHTLRLSGCYKTVYSEEDAVALGSMAALSELRLHSGRLCDSFFTHLRQLERLSKLALHWCSCCADGWTELADAMAAWPLTFFDYLHSNRDGMPPAALFSICQWIGSDKHRLAAVKLQLTQPKWSSEELRMVVDALADCFCRSSVRSWKLNLPGGGIDFLRAWGGHAKPQPLSLLSLGGTTSLQADVDSVSLLLQCLRSCAAVADVHVRLKPLEEEVVRLLVAATTEEPPLPLRVSARLRPHTFRAVADLGADKLDSLGIRLL
eukprot:PLAT7649.1.p1 GENE.PLAT7649.1~~PLAT7649.1.p1  ORF type:complete len:575 (+),score=202.80 PLAT7649.1:366-2090(+)